LIGRNVDKVHSTGTCELEECIREAILAECVAAEFPYGAVPVLAIISTGQYQERVAEAGIERDTNLRAPLCLLVRPLFVRPAHFQRAVGFATTEPRPGLADKLRTQAMVETGAKLWSAIGFMDNLRDLYKRWSQQLAYGYVHRMCHGGCSPSNITLDGALLDFGATAALPDWGRAVTLHCGPEAGREIPLMLRSLADVLKQVARYCPDADVLPADVVALERMALHVFTQQVQIEALRVLGLSRTQANRLLLSPQGDAVVVGLNRLLRKDAGHCYVTFEATPEPRDGWLADSFWDGALDHVCGSLREQLSKLLWGAECDDSSRQMHLTRLRNHQRARTRTTAFREILRSSIQAAMSDAHANQSQVQRQIGSYIGEQVLAMRVDSRAEPVGAAAIGFAFGAYGNGTIYRRLGNAETFVLSDEINLVGTSFGGDRQRLYEPEQYPASQPMETTLHPMFGQLHWLTESLEHVHAAVAA
jgi:hypothetical protein